MENKYEQPTGSMRWLRTDVDTGIEGMVGVKMILQQEWRVLVLGEDKFIASDTMEWRDVPTVEEKR